MRRFTGMLAFNALLALAGSPLAQSADLEPMMKMWRSDPVFANLDGLSNYGMDFGNPIHSFYTSMWRVERGFLTPAEQQSQYVSGGLTVPVRGATTAIWTTTPEYATRGAVDRDFPSAVTQPIAENAHARTFVEQALKRLATLGTETRASMFEQTAKAE